MLLISKKIFFKGSLIKTIIQDATRPRNPKIITSCALFGLDFFNGITASCIVENTGVSFFNWSFACSTCFEISSTTALIIWNSDSNLFFSFKTNELTEFKFESEKKASFE